MEKIVLSGAPGSGKTSVITELEHRGYRVEHEVIRDYTAKLLEEKTGTYENPLEALDDPMPFNRDLLNARLEVLQQTRHTPCFFDRGTVDVLGYMKHFNQDYPTYFEELCRDHRYTQVFYFEPWEKIYIPDSTRLETFKSVLHINKALQQAYSYFGYTLVVVPQLSVRERADFILNTINL